MRRRRSTPVSDTVTQELEGLEGELNAIVNTEDDVQLAEAIKPGHVADRMESVTQRHTSGRRADQRLSSLV